MLRWLRTGDNYMHCYVITSWKGNWKWTRYKINKKNIYIFLNGFYIFLTSFFYALPDTTRSKLFAITHMKFSAFLQVNSQRFFSSLEYFCILLLLCLLTYICIYILCLRNPNNLRAQRRVVIATRCRDLYSPSTPVVRLRVSFRVGGVFPRRWGWAIRFPTEAGVETMNRPTGVLPANLQT